MSTFTRLYFTNRGPSIADNDSQDAPEAAGEGFVSPETIPLNTDQDVVWQIALAKLADLPHPPKVLRLQPSPALGHEDGWPEDDRDPSR